MTPTEVALSCYRCPPSKPGSACGASGRTLRPSDRLAVVNRSVTARFRWAQRRGQPHNGHGLVASARLP
jgi:hypothetical protein